MNEQTLKSFAVNLLDDAHGINEAAYNDLVALCEPFPWWADIAQRVDSAESDVDTSTLRFFLNEGDVEELRG